MFIATTVELTRRLLDLGISEISLGDTTGMGDPALVERVIQALGDAGIDLSKLALHMHDTQGTGLANVLAGYQMGIRTFDGSTAGLGGCPYAPGASGNVATEDIINMFHKMGCPTGGLGTCCWCRTFLSHRSQQRTSRTLPQVLYRFYRHF